MVDDRFAEARRRLILEIEQEAAVTEPWTGRSRFAPAVMAAIARVPRHEFVATTERDIAYANRPLPIGHGQTISQPYIVAVMTDLLDIAPGDRVLEIGTGCGYQAAVLAELAKEVFSVEVVPTLAAAARERLIRLGYRNVSIRVGDGYDGWPEHAPFDGIIVTSAPPRIPDRLAEQLRPGGRLVIPVGAAGETQMLFRCEKTSDGAITKEAKLPVAFVPMVPAGPAVE
ncbi:MAG: protein-L-isoaspartate(D-aspartate) O-methyltransferase [Rhodospirillales bacterium]|nr:MAG: protein-L-isoaspartate(D-aspartate) O-methyltransferase [Rhodospirillales bacterium]